MSPLRRKLLFVIGLIGLSVCFIIIAIPRHPPSVCGGTLNSIPSACNP